MNPSASVGICMIVRNAEDTIATALRSCTRLAAQIVVVDTGSTDTTPRLCARFATELHFHSWRNSFAEARNYALQYMRTEWILALDADEVLDPSSLHTLPSLLSTPHIGGLRVAIHNTLSGNSASTSSIHHYPRLFRRHPAIRYTGIIHEQIGDAITKAGFSLADSPVVLQHHGYASASSEKIRRNTAMLRAELEQDPNNAWLHYHLGLTEFAAQHKESAAQHLTQALCSDALSAEQREFALLRLAQIALGNSDWNEFEKRISFSSPDRHREGLRQYLMAVRCAVSGSYTDALALLSQQAVQTSSLIDQEQYEALVAVCRQQTHL